MFVGVAVCVFECVCGHASVRQRDKRGREGMFALMTVIVFAKINHPGERICQTSEVS